LLPSSSLFCFRCRGGTAPGSFRLLLSSGDGSPAGIRIRGFFLSDLRGRTGVFVSPAHTDFFRRFAGVRVRGLLHADLRGLAGVFIRSTHPDFLRRFAGVWIRRFLHADIGGLAGVGIRPAHAGSLRGFAGAWIRRFFHADFRGLAGVGIRSAHTDFLRRFAGVEVRGLFHTNLGRLSGIDVGSLDPGFHRGGPARTGDGGLSHERGVPRLVVHSRDASNAAGPGDRERCARRVPNGSCAIHGDCDRAVRSPPRRVEPEVKRGAVGTVVRAVHPGDQRPGMDVHGGRRHVVIRAVDDLVAAHLHVVGLVAGLFHLDRGNVLELVLRQRHLQDDQARIVRVLLHDPDVINFSVRIEIEIVDAGFRVVEGFFELFHVLRFLEHFTDSLQIQPLGRFRRGSHDSDVFLRSKRTIPKQQYCRRQCDHQ